MRNYCSLCPHVCRAHLQKSLAKISTLHKRAVVHKKVSSAQKCRFGTRLYVWYVCVYVCVYLCAMCVPAAVLHICDKTDSNV